MLIRKHHDATAEVEERASASMIASTKLAPLIKKPGKILLKADLFDEGLKVAGDFHDLELPKFVLIMVKYQKKFEETFQEFRDLLERFLHVSGKGKQQTDPKPSSSTRRPGSSQQQRQQDQDL